MCLLSPFVISKQYCQNLQEPFEQCLRKEQNHPICLSPFHRTCKCRFHPIKRSSNLDQASCSNLDPIYLRPRTLIGTYQRHQWAGLHTLRSCRRQLLQHLQHTTFPQPMSYFLYGMESLQGLVILFVPMKPQPCCRKLLLPHLNQQLEQWS